MILVVDHDFEVKKVELRGAIGRLVGLCCERGGNKRDGGKKGEIMSSPILPGNGHVLRSIA